MTRSRCTRKYEGNCVGCQYNTGAGRLWVNSRSGSGFVTLITCAHPSVIIWLGWLEWRGRGGLCCLLMYSSKEGKMLELCGPGGGKGACRAAEAAAAAAGTLVDDGWEGQFFFPTRDAVREIGAGVGLLAWLRSSEFVRAREAVGACVGVGGGRPLGVVWGSVSISESESVSFSSPHSLSRTFWSAPYCPIWAGRNGVADHVSGFELIGSGELLRSCGLPDIPARNLGAQIFLQQVFSGRGHRYLNVEVK